MKIERMLALFFLIFAVLATPSRAQVKAPAETRNAALRYWLAFAELQDPPADKIMSDHLEKTAAGETPWDEAKLGAILDQNEAAIWRMQRATKLPDCDWGIEYDLGPRASSAYVPRARVLARLNTLAGMREAAKGETQKAVDTWLAGIRFSQHLSQGGTLIFSLVAKMTLLSNVQALTKSAQSNSLSETQRKQVEATIRALPATGFSWSAALRQEEASIDVSVEELRKAADPALYFVSVTGQAVPANFSVPTAAEAAAFHKTMLTAENALDQPPDTTNEKLESLSRIVKTLHPFFQATTPSFVKINAARAEVQTTREKLLQTLISKPS